ncbi:MauE/DoxX family redox-associated membrane protein [Pedobacter sp. KBW06]|uniref:MauE/DoxX family redox-associated membrane protein n=1 Tax=Pedobacter sp. KBW06 TaxID=2153359 RepID=UPI00131576D1|nr:MauE/DoxX family redox-associated membrane protein [Pedobacter sp. KBW06]
MSVLIYTIIALFIALWIYAAVPKLRNIKYFKEVLKSQAIPKWSVPWLSWMLPVVELGTVVLLIIPETRLRGMYISLLMMTVFTVYVSGIIYQVYDIYPCPCGGVFSRIGWKKHFKVNLLLTLIAAVGVVLMEMN